MSSERKKESALPSAPGTIENKIEDRSHVEVSPTFSQTFAPTFAPQVLVASQDKTVAPQIEKEDEDKSASLSILKAKEVLLHQNQIGIWYEASTDLQHALERICSTIQKHSEAYR